MAELKDVINFIILYSEESQDPLTNMRLNKFLYFAQGHSFKVLGRPLFNDDFKAWEYGPVIPEVYHQYRDYGKGPIDSIEDYNPDALSSDEVNFLLDVLYEYDKYSTGKLVTLSHINGGPWDEVRIEKQSILIPKESIKKHFENEELKSTFDELLQRIPEEGRHDKDGHIILQKGFDD